MSSSAFREKYGPWAIIAGGSEGIGRSFAEQLAGLGLNLILLSRRAEVLQQLKQEIEAAHGVQVVGMAVDLVAPDLGERIDRIVAEYDVGLLIYNAGAVHGASLFLDEQEEQLLDLIRLNCIGPVLMVHKFAQRMRQRKRGGVILMSSMSALAGGAYVAAYAATKAFDMILAEGLWDELRSCSVDVLGLIAGATSTPAMMNSGVRFDVAASGDGVAPAIVPMAPDDVAREALERLGKTPIHVAGANNAISARAMREADRGAAIVAMGAAAAKLYGKNYPL